MADQASLFSIFGDFRPSWPRPLLGPTSFTVGPDPDYDAWLGHINDGIRLKDITTNAAADRVVMQARYWVDTAAAAYLDGLPFVISTMPDVEFRVLELQEAKAGYLFVTQSDAGIELQIEGLPVEIRLPPGMLGLHPDDEATATPPFQKVVGSFSAGGLDSQEVTHRRDGPSSIKTHMRVRVTADQKVVIATPVPVSFGKCRFLDIPALAVHDFRLIPCPDVAQDSEEWLRHGIGPWVGSTEGPFAGCFAVRGLDLDPTKAPLSDVLDWANGNAQTTDVAHFVLDDVVVPFFSPWILPIPRHITVGIRRNIDNPLDPHEIFDFEQAPVQLKFGSDPNWGMIIESFYYESQPLEAIDDTLNIGITFSAAIYYGKINEANHAFTVGLGENLTPRIGYRREIDVNTGVLTEDGTEFNALKFELLGTKVEIMAVTLGYSIGRAVGEDASFGDCAELYGSLFLSSEPTGGNDAFFKLRTLHNEPVRLVIESVGWRQGSFHLEGASAPDGVMIMFGPVGFIVQELGLIAESGASYFSFSGGLVVAPPGGLEGGVTVKRLRFRIAGNADAPLFKLDGIFAYFRGSNVTIEAGGYYTDETIDGTRRKEFGFTGTILINASAVEYGLGVDLLIGDIESPAGSFDYFMVQATFRGLIPVYAVEIRGIRALFANHMLPKLSPIDDSVAQLRYYSWYKANDPVRVPGDRRLASWKPEDQAWAFGVGATLSLTGLGNVARLTAFVAGLDGPSENGLMVALELYLLTAKKPSAYAVVDIDLEHDRFAILFGVDIKISDFIDSLPDWLNVLTLKGELLIGNKPGTVALGRIKDQRSWLSLIFDLDVWVFRSFLQVGLCFEWVDGGDVGFGFVVRVEGGLNVGVVRITYHAGVGLTYISFSTGSVDQALAAFIEAGVRAVLFGFLRFGLSVTATFKWVERGSRTEFAAEIRFETPWFLPDITVRLEHTSGTVVPSELAAFTAPLQAGSAHQELTGSAEAPKGGAGFSIHQERLDPPVFDPRTGEELPRNTNSINRFNATTLDEGPRIARFEANNNIKPIPIDSTIAIEFTARVDDALGLGPVPANQGVQNSGDLGIRYELTGLRIRRRPRFNPAAAWTVVEERIELSVDFDSPGGPTLSGSFEPHEITKFWATDIRTADGTATRKLLLNATTPYDFVTSNPEADEGVVGNNPDWPCCPRGRDKGVGWTLHRLDFHNEPPGIDLSGYREFTQSHSRWRAIRTTVARPHLLGSLPPGTVVGGTETMVPGTLYRVDLDEPAIYCTASVAWFGTVKAELHLVAYNGIEEVGRTPVDALGSSDFSAVSLIGSRPFSAFELQLVTAAARPNAAPAAGAVFAAAFKPSFYLEADQFAYISWEEYLRAVRDTARCDPTRDDFKSAWEAKGKLFFLPNHQYEIETKVRMTASHPSVASAQTSVKEYLYFATKGLPGLNAQQRVGEEVERYVRSVYMGGRSRVYRAEPVAIAFQEDFHVAVPLALRPPGTIDERHQLFQMALTTRPDTAPTGGTTYTSTSADWIVAHRTVIVPGVFGAWKPQFALNSTGVAKARSAHPMRKRLGQITQRPSATCPLADPADVISPLLIARPQGVPDPDHPGAELWLADSRYRATVRQKDGPFVDRMSFVGADLTALAFRSDGGTGSWNVADGDIVLNASGLRYGRFGDGDWNHVRAQLALRPGTGRAGLALSLAGGSGTPHRALYAVIRPRGGGGRELALLRRLSGTELVSLASAAVPEDEWQTLEVLAFDDMLRARVGDVVVEAARGELREGHLALVGSGAVRFRSLQVEALDIYTFTYATSRYRSFNAHIQSCDGQLRAIAPDTLGPGSTTRTVASLWSETRSDIDAAMQPAGAVQARQDLFRRWAEGLGLPLVQEIDHVQISRLTNGTAIQGLLLESPEPVDFSDEVRVTLRQRVRVPGGGFGGVWPGLEAVLREALGRKFKFADFEVAPPIAPGAVAPDPRIAKRLGDLIDKPALARTFSDIAAGKVAASPETASRAVPAHRVDGMLGAELVGDALQVQLRKRAAKRGEATLRAGDRVDVIELAAAPTGGRISVKTWAGKAARRGAGSLGARAESIGTVNLNGARLGLAADQIALLDGIKVAIDPARGLIIDWHFPSWQWRDVTLAVLQDETAQRALLVPIDAARNAIGLTSGAYEIKFKIDRARWTTTDPPDADNRYQDESMLVLAATP